MEPKEVSSVWRSSTRGTPRTSGLCGSLTDGVTAPHMKRRDLAKTRNEMLGRVEQWVAALPVDFVDFIKYDQVAPAPQTTLKNED